MESPLDEKRYNLMDIALDSADDHSGYFVTVDPKDLIIENSADAQAHAKECATAYSKMFRQKLELPTGFILKEESNRGVGWDENDNLYCIEFAPKDYIYADEPRLHQQFDKAMLAAFTKAHDATVKALGQAFTDKVYDLSRIQKLER